VAQAATSEAEGVRTRRGDEEEADRTAFFEVIIRPSAQADRRNLCYAAS
jgi:hypothetical protein